MSYINAITKDDESGERIWVWERVNNKRFLKKYRVPYYFYTKDPIGEHISIFGDTLKKHEFPNFFAFKDAQQRYRDERKQLFESDIPTVSKILSANYYNEPAPKLNISFLDIEVDFNRNLGFSSVENPYGEIIAVALYHQWQNHLVVYTIPPDGIVPNTQDFIAQMESKEPLPKDVEFDIVFCKTESELLNYFIEEIYDADILSGWNSGFFDVPYIAKRLVACFGKGSEERLCFKNAGMPKWDEVDNKRGRKETALRLKGRQDLDYLLLYKKYTVIERSSYKLAAISEAELPNLPKMGYSGTLNALYRNDYPFFVRYNIRDVEILKGFEEKLGFIALANEISHLTTSTFTNVTGTLKLTEAAIINYCHYVLNRIVPDKKEMGGGYEYAEPGDTYDERGDIKFEAGITKPTEKKSTAKKDGAHIKGAYVLEPVRGMHEWIGSVDINSLYPSAMRAINISPEALIGQFQEKESASECIARGDEHVELILSYDAEKDNDIHTAVEWRDILLAKKWAVSGYGTVFDQNKEGIIPSILTSWYTTRKDYQKQAKEAKDSDTAKYFDRLQIVFKYLLNSAYGALSNQYFKFYDLRAGESVTGTGRFVLKHQCAEVNRLLTGIYDTHGDAIVAGDTDSSYFLTYANNKAEAIQIADAVGEGVNASFPAYMRQTFLCNPGYDSVIRAGREVVADRGIFVEKKRYVLHVVDKEGKTPKPGDEIKMMGLDIKRTTIPKQIAVKLHDFIKRLLENESWNTIAEDIISLKDEVAITSDFMSIGLPKGLSADINAYTRAYKSGEKVKLPGHVAAAIMWNNQLTVHNDMLSPQILRGTKVKVFYLTCIFEKKFKNIGVPVDIEQLPSWFIEEFYPIIDREAHVEKLIDDPLDNIFKAINKQTPSRQSLLVDNLLGF